LKQAEKGSDFKTVFVMRVKNGTEDQRRESRALLEKTLPYADEYVVYYPPEEDQHIEERVDSDDEDVEPDSVETTPKLVQAELRIDVPYEFAKNLDEALATAWKHSLPGDQLVIFIEGANKALDILKKISRTVPNKGITPNVSPEPDEDPQGRHVGFSEK
jgi:hypothetical protein